jgi:hypothetical protein
VSVDKLHKPLRQALDVARKHGAATVVADTQPPWQQWQLVVRRGELYTLVATDVRPRDPVNNYVDREALMINDVQRARLVK